MNYLIARISNRVRSGRYVMILDGVDIFTIPSDLSSSIEYQNSYILGEGEYFKLVDFSSKTYCHDLLRSEFNSTSYSIVASADYSRLKYLCSYQDERYYFFQKCNKSSIVKNKLIRLNQPALIENDGMLVIRDSFDAIYDKEDDVLYFTSLRCISSIFNGIQDLYREATQQETIDFLNNDIINLQNGFSADHVKIPNRRKIAIAIDTLRSFSSSDKSSICSYIQSYCPNLNFDGQTDKFDVSNEEELKNLLYGIDQRFYTTGVGEEKRIANSILRIQI